MGRCMDGEKGGGGEKEQQVRDAMADAGIGVEERRGIGGGDGGRVGDRSLAWLRG